ncbi:MAG: hypothetical protein O7D95_01235 [Betaproteobacteria bacterium]|nr:hypothetical protein [Betaproteobacteria bacterium]
MQGESSEKLDSLMVEIVKVSGLMNDVSKEVHKLNNRMIGIETVLNGINGVGGVVDDIKNMGQKLHRHGNQMNKFQKDISVLENDHDNLKSVVKDHNEKIKTLFIENNNNKVNSAGISAKLAMIITFISTIMAAIVGLGIKYIESK